MDPKHFSPRIGFGFSGFSCPLSGVDEKGHHHDRDECHDPGLFLEEEALGVESGILQEAVAPFDRLSLGLIGLYQGEGGERLQGGGHSGSFLFDPLFESLLLPENVLPGVDEKNPLQDPGIDRPDLYPLVSGGWTDPKSAGGD